MDELILLGTVLRLRKLVGYYWARFFGFVFKDLFIFQERRREGEREREKH